jgi:predicted metalloendopeptidase
MNEIVFPAPIQQPPFVVMYADHAVNYRANGPVICHEIGHGFDDQGSGFDGAGIMRDWWSVKDKDAF